MVSAGGPMIQKVFKTAGATRCMIQLFFAAPIILYSTLYFHAKISQNVNSTKQGNCSAFAQRSNDPWVDLFNRLQPRSYNYVENSSVFENVTRSSMHDIDNQGLLLLTTGMILFIVIAWNFGEAIAPIPRKENSPPLVLSKTSPFNLRNAFKNVTFDKSNAVTCLTLFVMFIQIVDSMAASRGIFIFSQFSSTSLEAAKIFWDLKTQIYAFGSLIALGGSIFVSGKTMLIVNVIVSFASLTFMTLFQDLGNDRWSLVFFLIHTFFRPSMFSSFLVFVTEFFPLTGALSASFFIATLTGRCMSGYFMVEVGSARHGLHMASMCFIAFQFLIMAGLNIPSIRNIPAIRSLLLKFAGKKQREIKSKNEQEKTKNENMPAKNVVWQVLLKMSVT